MVGDGYGLRGWRYAVIVSDGPGFRMFVERETGGSYDLRSVAIGLMKDNCEILAGIVYDQCNGASVVCHMAAKRLNREFLRFNAHYAFNQLGVRKIVAPVASHNARMIKLALNMGFTPEACLEDCDPDGDLFLFTLAKQDCKFLGEKYDGQAKTARIA